MSRMRARRAQPLAKTSRARRDPELAREEALRPCPFLGFDRDKLGCYLIERGAVEIAESQFRRAVWLNPYESSFRIHWALALLKLERKPEAHDVLREALRKNPDDKEALVLWRRNWPDEQPTAPPAEVGP